MISCPYERDRCPAESNYQAHCLVLSAAAGFKVTVAGPCEYCVQQKEWELDKEDALSEDAVKAAPITEAQAMELVQKSEMFKSLYKDAMSARLIDGDCARYQAQNPIDVDAAFSKYREAYGDEDAKELLAEMLGGRLQKASVQIAGCDSEPVARDKVVTLAEKHGFVTAAKALILRSL